MRLRCARLASLGAAPVGGAGRSLSPKRARHSRGGLLSPRRLPPPSGRASSLIRSSASAAQPRCVSRRVGPQRRRGAGKSKGSPRAPPARPRGPPAAAALAPEAAADDAAQCRIQQRPLGLQRSCRARGGGARGSDDAVARCSSSHGGVKPHVVPLARCCPVPAPGAPGPLRLLLHRPGWPAGSRRRRRPAAPPTTAARPCPCPWGVPVPAGPQSRALRARLRGSGGGLRLLPPRTARGL